MVDQRNANPLADGAEDAALKAVCSPGCGEFYEIRVKGQLDSRWSEWLEGLEVKYLENEEMVLYGPIVDQAALVGVLNKLAYLNLVLLSVNSMKGTN